MRCFISVSSAIRPALFCLLLTLIWTAQDVWAAPTVRGGDQKPTAASRLRRSTSTSNDRKIVPRNEVSGYEAWRNYETKWAARSRDPRHCVAEKMAYSWDVPADLGARAWKADVFIDFYRWSHKHVPAEVREVIERSMEECARRFELEDSFDEKQKQYYRACIHSRAVALGSLTDIGEGFCVGYALGRVDPDLLFSPEDELRPIVKQLNLAVNGEPRSSVKQQVHNFAEKLNNGFKKLVPHVGKVINASPAFGSGSPVGGVSRPMGGGLRPF